MLAYVIKLENESVRSSIVHLVVVCVFSIQKKQIHNLWAFSSTK